MYSQRNKNKQRFKTQTFKEGLTPPSPQESKPYMTFHSPPAQQQLMNSRCNSEPSVLLVQNLQKHVQYIEKRLHDTELQLQKISNNNEWLKSQVLEKQAIIIRNACRIQEEELKTKEILSKYQMLQADFANFQLQQKVDQLNKELNQQKDYEKRSDTLNRSGRKDKFSSAFFPSPFGSPKHFQQKSPEAFQNMTKESIPELDSNTVKNPFDNSLWTEWRKLKTQKVKKEKQINILIKKVDDLKQELNKQKKESSRVKTELLRTEEKFSGETSKLKSRIVTYIKDQKMLMNQLKHSEQKMFELSTTMKEKGEAEGQRFFAHSSALELQQIFQKISHNLEFDSGTIDITISHNEKQEGFSQTEEIEDEHLDIIKQLQMRVKEKDEELSQQQKEWLNRLENSSNEHLIELKEASDLIDVYKCRIEHLEKQFVEQKQKQTTTDQLEKEVVYEYHTKQSQPIQTRQIQVTCDIISMLEWQGREQILHRVQQLLELNQSLKNRIQQLEAIRAELQQKNIDIQQKYSHDKHILMAKVEEDQGQIQMEQSDCANCSKSKGRILEREIKIMESGHIIEELHNEKDHFFNAYQDKMNQYSHLEEETRQEMEKLKGELMQKDKAFAHLLYESQLKNEDYSRQKEEVRQLRNTVEKLQGKIELYEQQMHRYNDGS